MKRIFSQSKSPIMAVKIQRNEMCPCGSGKKAKYCCGANTKYFTRVRNQETSMFEVSLMYIGEIMKAAFCISFLTFRIDKKEYSLFDLLIDSKQRKARVKLFFIGKGLTFKY